MGRHPKAQGPPGVVLFAKNHDIMIQGLLISLFVILNAIRAYGICTYGDPPPTTQGNHPGGGGGLAEWKNPWKKGLLLIFGAERKIFWDPKSPSKWVPADQVSMAVHGRPGLTSANHDLCRPIMSPVDQSVLKVAKYYQSGQKQSKGAQKKVS